MYDILSVGDATMDHLAVVEDASVNCSINQDHCLLCFTYADKIPIKKLSHEVAGNAANNAVGSARLGMKTAFWTILGSDSGGKQIHQKMIDEGVDPVYVELHEGEETNNSIVLNYHAERTILIYHVNRQYKVPKLEKAEWMYLTSMGHGWEVISEDIITYVNENKVKMAFNPGTFQLKSGMEVLRPLFQVCEVLFVNKEEAETLVNNGKPGDISFLLMALKKEGPKIVVITDGSKGAYAYEGKDAYSMGICKASVVEKTGAGDAFGTAFVVALHNGKSIQDAMMWGTANSGSVVEKIGPQAGLLRKGEIDYVINDRCVVEHIEPKKM